MDMVPIYSIGYGNRPVADLIAILKEHKIDFVVDVRSIPASKYNPAYNKNALAAALDEQGIRYVFMGDTLGGRPKDQSCYVDGKVDYSRCKDATWFKGGMGRLKTAWEKKLRVAVMCSESKPEMCHRSKLIGQELAKIGIEMVHIDEKAKIKSQTDVISMLVGESAFGQGELQFISRKRYRKSDAPDVR